MVNNDQQPRQRERPLLSDRQLANIELDRSCYDAIASTQATLLDKSIISIAGASFSLSIGFIDKLIPLDKAALLWALWMAMLILALSIIVTVLSFWAGERSARFRRSLCDDAEKNCDTEILYNKNPWDTPLALLNSSRLIFFVFGIALLAGFIFYNGMNRTTVSENQQQHGVSYGSTPPQATPTITSKDSTTTHEADNRGGDATTATPAGASDTAEEHAAKKIENAGETP